MSRTVRKQLFQAIDTLRKANEYIEKLITDKREKELSDLLLDCQDCAIAIGGKIEKLYGEDTQAVHSLETYCETIYLISQNDMKSIENKQLIAQTRIQLLDTYTFMEQEIPDRLEVVFLPYKSSMWDSLESVWLAARDDEACDDYVVPIPYYDRNSDGSFGEMHYEGNEYPDYVPITAWNSYDMEERKPDIVYIHNPYDDANIVTSVHPNYYSKELKKYTDTLVYIPYYVTSGGMSEGQRMCSAYRYADYIIIQAPKYRDFFDESIPDEKFLALGSPKFDRVIHKCQNPPEPPEEWKAKLKGKKVYFYNTSIGGMLENTEDFLKKMEYVFNCFKGRTDACLLWRPHPLLESTFESMRAAYKPIYDTLKSMFINCNFGIYDTTPDIADTIALCDAYIGDSASSVTALFGIAGKPIFILNNHIHSEPTEDDWRGEIITNFNFRESTDQWMISRQNKLFFSPKDNYCYEFCCNLSDYAEGSYYLTALTFDEKTYVCPCSAQDILVLENGKIQRKIELRKLTEKSIAFSMAIRCKEFIFLIPCNYPALVRVNTKNDRVDYFTEQIDVFSCRDNGQQKVGGACEYGDYLFIASPICNLIFSIHIVTGKVKILRAGGKEKGGAAALVRHGEEIWVLPYHTYNIKRWNPNTKEVREYSNVPQNFKCIHQVQKYECSELPFSSIAFLNDNIVLSPYWGNKYLKLNLSTGEMKEWIPLHSEVRKSDYYGEEQISYFIRPDNNRKENYYLFFKDDYKLYTVNIENGKMKELPISCNLEELKEHEAGFSKQSDWLKYGCKENAFNSLSSFISNEIVGNQFDKEKQRTEYGEIITNNDGTCGNQIHLYLMESYKKQEGENVWLK